ncbi:MAG: HTTM domain-containing protein [Planctomycetota bacterium]
MIEAWNRFWFAPAGPKGLGITRALVCAALAVNYARNDFATWGTVSVVFRQPPTFPVPVAPEGWILAFHRLWLAALALSAVGLFTRVSTVLAFLLGAYLIALDGSFGRVHHNDVAVVIALGVFAASRAGDAVSVDALRRKSPVPPSGEYRWPLRAIALALAAAFFAAGVSKLRHSGLAWMTSDNLEMQILARRYYPGTPGRVGLWLVGFPLLCRAVALGTVVIELLYPLALVSARARIVLVPASLLMLVGIALFLGPRFTTFAFLSLAWVPWDRLGARLTPGRGSPAPAP